MNLQILKRMTLILSPIFAIILASTIIFLSAYALTYQPGLTPGMEMEYEFLHYSDVKDATVTVMAVEGNLVELKTVSNYYSGDVNEQNITINIGVSEKTTIVPTDRADGWLSIHGSNNINVIDDHLEITMTPEDGYAEVGYSFQEPLKVPFSFSFKKSFHASRTSSAELVPGSPPSPNGTRPPEATFSFAYISKNLLNGIFLFFFPGPE